MTMLYLSSLQQQKIITILIIHVFLIFLLPTIVILLTFKNPLSVELYL